MDTRLRGYDRVNGCDYTWIDTMLLRPYTISGFATALLQLYVVIYLFVLQADDPAQRRLNRFFAAVWLLFALFVVQISWPLTVVSENDPLKLLVRFTTNTLGIVFIASCFRFVYALLAVEGSPIAAEWKWVKRGLGFMCLLEVGFTVFRLAVMWQRGEITPRPLWWQLPLSISLWWLLITLVRAYWLESRDAGMKAGFVPLWYAIRNPLTPLGRFLRDLVLSVLVAVVMALLFITASSQFTIPTWLANQSDLTSMAAILIALFAYLRYQRNILSLELRLTSVGLAIFLAINSILGWVISSIFLRLELPGVPIPAIIGSGSNPDFILDPAYLPVVSRLHQLLLPLLWFLIIGSALFVLAFWLYYRRYEATAFRAILTGIGKLEAGDLSYRISGYWTGEAGRIANAFNAMAESLMQINAELNRYQIGLEEVIVTRTRQLAVEIEQRKERELQSAIQEERARIAREAHDSTLQSLLAVRMRLRSRRLRRAQPDVLHAELDELAQDVLQSVRELRQFIYDVATDQPQEELSLALSALVDRFRKSYPQQISLMVECEIDALPAAHQSTILRFAQEALSNAAKHSQATAVIVAISLAKQALTVRVSDNGIGIPSQPRSDGYGLQNMRDRAQIMGGVFAIYPNQPQGTIVALQLPLPADSRE